MESRSTLKLSLMWSRRLRSSALWWARLSALVRDFLPGWSVCTDEKEKKKAICESETERAQVRVAHSHPRPRSTNIIGDVAALLVKVALNVALALVAGRRGVGATSAHPFLLLLRLLLLLLLRRSGLGETVLKCDAGKSGGWRVQRAEGVS